MSLDSFCIYPQLILQFKEKSNFLCFFVTYRTVFLRQIFRISLNGGICLKNIGKIMQMRDAYIDIKDKAFFGRKKLR